MTDTELLQVARTALEKLGRPVTMEYYRDLGNRQVMLQCPRCGGTARIEDKDARSAYCGACEGSDTIQTARSALAHFLFRTPGAPDRPDHVRLEVMLRGPAGEVLGTAETLLPPLSSLVARLGREQVRALTPLACGREERISEPGPESENPGKGGEQWPPQ